MKANDLLDMIGDADDNLIAEAKEPRKVFKTRWIKGVAIAACCCLAIGSVTAAAASGMGTRIVEFFTARKTGPDLKESGYDLSVEIEKIREDALSEEIQQAGNRIRQQFIDYKPTDSRLPGELQADFESRDQACRFVGLKQIKTFAVDWEEQATTLRVSGNEQGKILNADLETDYQAGDVRMQFFTQIYTENYDEEIIIETLTTEDIGFKESYFTTANNIQCHVIESSALESGYQGLDGFIVADGILYNLYIAYLEKDAGQAEALLHQWAEMF